MTKLVDMPIAVFAIFWLLGSLPSIYLDDDCARVTRPNPQNRKFFEWKFFDWPPPSPPHSFQNNSFSSKKNFFLSRVSTFHSSFHSLSLFLSQFQTHSLSLISNTLTNYIPNTISNSFFPTLANYLFYFANSFFLSQKWITLSVAMFGINYSTYK